MEEINNSKKRTNILNGFSISFFGVTVFSEISDDRIYNLLILIGTSLLGTLIYNFYINNIKSK